MENNRQNSTNINWYPGHMAKTKREIKEQLKYIDLIYEVIDARIPYSSKIRDIDPIIKDKPRILIMTKKDLCDEKETNKWAVHYKKLGYTVFLQDTIHLNKKDLEKATEEIMKPWNQKREKQGLKPRKIRILVIGIPNVGKSTLINQLVNKKVVAIGNRPGITKQLHWIRLNDKMELLDSPGILWPKLEEQTVAFNLATFSAIKEEILPLYEVTIYILKMLLTYYPEIAKERYQLEKIEDEITMLDKIAKKRGCLIKGGEVDYEKVYAVVLNDIKNGNIKGVTFDRYE